MKKQTFNAVSQLAFIALASIAGIAVFTAIKRLGAHLVVEDAHLWGLTTAVFVYLAQFLFASRQYRKARGVSYNTRLGMVFITLCSLLGSTWLGGMQIKRGYPNLTKVQALAEASIGKHFSLESEVNPSRAYEMNGNLGGFKLLPALNYDAQILIMVPDFPRTKRIRVTGQLRDDIRTVQRSRDGKVEGPFLQVYREDMNLSEGTRILFFDTSSRAGLNFTIVLWFLVSLYLLIYSVRLIPVPVHRSTVKFKS